MIQHIPTTDEILTAVAAAWDINQLALLSSCRQHRICHARQAAMWLMRTQTDLSFMDIGRVLSDMDHSTVMHGVAAAEKRAKADRIFSIRLMTAMQTLDGDQ